MKCQLCNSRKEKRVVAETEHSFSVVNIEPLKTGHVMVLPKRCIDNANKMDAEEAKDFLDLVSKIQEVVALEYGEDPVMIQNCGKHRSQTQHIHYHIIPSKDASRVLFANAEGTPLRQRVPMEELAKVADKLKERMT